jgi:hypothetical protein
MRMLGLKISYLGALGLTLGVSPSAQAQSGDRPPSSEAPPAEVLAEEPATAASSEPAAPDGQPKANQGEAGPVSATSAAEAGSKDTIPGEDDLLAPSTPGEPGPKELVGPPEEKPPAWYDSFKLGGGGILYLYQPTEGGNNNFSLFFANLVLDAQWSIFGLHVEPRFRDTRLRPFFEGPVWVQEFYGSIKLDPVILKLGKVYKKNAGFFWDNSFYGNVQVYDGLKLDPNYGASLEGAVGDKLGVNFSAQYFVVDGRTNVSLQGRDTISIPDARRRNTVTGRVEPYFKFGHSQVSAAFGAEYFDADIPNQKEGVTRVGGDAKFTHEFEGLGSLGVWGEFVHQDGRHVVDHPVTGAASGNNNYFQIGGELTFWRLTARYNVSHVEYKDANTTEILHVPALSFKVDDHLKLLGEYVVWRRATDGNEVPLDTSLNVTLHGFY